MLSVPLPKAVAGGIPSTTRSVARTCASLRHPPCNNPTAHRVDCPAGDSSDRTPPNKPPLIEQVNDLFGDAHKVAYGEFGSAQHSGEGCSVRPGVHPSPHPGRGHLSPP